MISKLNGLLMNKNLRNVDKLKYLECCVTGKACEKTTACEEAF